MTKINLTCKSSLRIWRGLHAIQAGHGDIEDYNLRFQLLGTADQRVPVLCSADHFASGLFEDVPKTFQDNAVIVCDNYPDFHIQRVLILFLSWGFVKCSILCGVRCSGKQRVKRKFSRAEDQTGQRCEEESERCRSDEFVRIGEDLNQGLVFGREVRDGHVNGQEQRDQARTKPQDQEDAAHQFESADEARVEGRRGCRDRQKNASLSRCCRVCPNLPGQTAIPNRDGP